jgi:hypothetical protein
MKKAKGLISILLVIGMVFSCGGGISAKTVDGANQTKGQTYDCIATMIEHAKQAIRNRQGTIHIDAPMTPLTNVFVNSIVSDQSIAEHGDDANQGAEFFDWYYQGKSTEYDHGGFTAVCTYEIGYSNPATRKALFNDTEATLYSDTWYDADGDRQVDGMIQIWTIDDFESGTFKYEAKSAVSPYLVRNDWLIIK